MKGRAVIAEKTPPVSAALKKFLESGGFETVVCASVDEALDKTNSGEPLLVYASAQSLDGAGLCQKLKERYPLVPVVLVYPPENDDPEAHAAAAGADAYLVGPLKRASVVFCAKTVLQIRALKETIERLEEEAKEKRRLPEREEEVTDPGGAAPPAGAPSAQGPVEGSPHSSSDFEFFKKLLLMEVKRSRRYRYPVSFLLVGVDHFVERSQPLPQKARTEVLAEVLRTLTESVRDIDLAMPFTEGRFLIFLPHTPRAGARVVAGRVRERMPKIAAPWSVTASIGVAAYEPRAEDEQVSFGTLMKEAADALRKAQLAGGNRVEAGADAAKRDRISLG